MEPFEERKKKFMEWLQVEYKAKMQEFGCDMYSFPFMVPDGQGAFKIVVQTDIVDVSNSPVKSPFSA